MKALGPTDGNQEEWTDVVKRRPKNNGSVDQKKAPPQAQKIMKAKNPEIIIRTDVDAFLRFWGKNKSHAQDAKR